MKQRILRLLTGTAAFFVLLFTIGVGHAMLTPSAMSNMGKEMPSNQCQSSCTSQTTVATPGQNINVDNKDIEPRPAEPYYLTFISVGWSLIVITISAAYLLRHLHWRPPDLFKFNVNYQF